MSDAIEPSATPSLPPAVATLDPLASDWSEGLRGAARALGIPEPKLLALPGPAPLPKIEPAIAPVAADPPVAVALAELPSAPLEAAAQPAVVDAPAQEIDVRAEETPASPPVETPPAVADSAPTPWSEPVPEPAAATEWSAAVAEPWAQAPLPAAPAAEASPWGESAGAPGSPAAAVEAPPEVAPPVDEVWSTPPPAEPVTEWQAEAPSSDWQQIKAVEAPAPESAPADWSSINSGPDWSAPPPADASAAVEEAWGSAPPPISDPQWSAPAETDPSWAAPVESAAAAEPDWTPPPPPPAPAWNAPPVGVSTFDQLVEAPPEDMAIDKNLFAAVPLGGSLAGDDEEMNGADLNGEAMNGAGDEPQLAPEPEPAAVPEELDSPEEVLKPVPAPEDDPDLLVPLVPIDEPQAQKPPSTPLASLRPQAVGALEVPGEHRVAVHTRGGRTLRGTVRDIDLSKSSFGLIPQGGGEPESIYHSDVKVIFFMLGPGEKARAADGAKVRVTLSDGRLIEGQRDGAEARHGFFLVPADAARTNTRRIYIAREAASDIRDS